MNIWIHKYNSINQSFKKKLVFRFGASSGFFSEYNNMVFAMLYCLKNELKFVLSSQNNVFSTNNGWNDFFKPFCEEDLRNFHVDYNMRPYELDHSRIMALKRVVMKKVNRVDYLTQDLWHSFHNQNFAKENFSIPYLDINHNLLGAAQLITDKIWIYQSQIEIEIDKALKALNLPNEYIGIHIRSGDKFIEHQLYNVGIYIEKIKKIAPNCKNLFIATDDYHNIELLNNNYQEYTIYSLCDKTSTGHIQYKFNDLDSSSKRSALISLFTDIEILTRANKFVGTFSSNVGMFVGMKLDADKCHGLDFPSWQFWQN